MVCHSRPWTSVSRKSANAAARCSKALSKKRPGCATTYIGTEHLFNGLTHTPAASAARMLVDAGLEPREVRNLIRREVGAGDDVVSEWPPLTPRAHRVLAMAVYLADDAGERFVTEEQVLLALLQEGEGVAGAHADQARGIADAVDRTAARTD